MSAPARVRLVRPSPLTWLAIIGGASTIAFSAGFLFSAYPSLPWLLPVHFKLNGYPNGWQFKTYARVLVPVFIQCALVLTLGAVAALLLSRPHGVHDEQSADEQAASVAAEGVALIAFIWVAFQGYATFALARMWQRERAGLGRGYLYFEIAGIVLTIAVAARTHLRLGHPRPGRTWRNTGDSASSIATSPIRRCSCRRATARAGPSTSAGRSPWRSWAWFWGLA